MDSVFPKPFDADIQDVAESVAIVVNGNNAPKAISSGQYLFIKNHSTLATGGYHATAAIGSGDAISSSNVAADADGIVNAAYASLYGNLTALSGRVSPLEKYVSYKETVQQSSSTTFSIALPSGGQDNEAQYLIFAGLRGYHVFNSSVFCAYLVGGSNTYANWVPLHTVSNITISATKGSPTFTVTFTKSDGGWGNAMIVAHRIW